MPGNVPLVQILSRRDCCLCEDVKEVVRRVAFRGLCEWEEIDIDVDPELQARYGMEIPVVLINGRKAFKHSLDESALCLRLSREQLRENATC